MSAVEIEVTLPSGQKYNQPTGLFINNEFVPALSGKTLTSFDPSTGKAIIDVHCAGTEDVDAAIAAARKSHLPSGEWRSMPVSDRVPLLLKLADLVEENIDILSAIECYDSGKPYHSNCTADVQSVADYLRYCAGWADKLHGTQIPLNQFRMAITKRYPLVVGCIVPWNYPLSMSSWKFCPALACGCSIVMKSSEITPLSLLYFAKLIKQAGFPVGVFNVLSGFGADAGSHMSTHTGLDKVAFTGSTLTGQKVMSAASSNLKSVSLECGGKSPLIVFKDTDLEETVKWASFGVMYNTGQNCTANSRILVDESIKDKFLSMYLEQVKKDWVMGNVFDEKTTLGPVVSKAQFDKVNSYIKIGVEEGATCHQPTKDLVPNEGYFIPPTIFSGVSEEMRIVKEEIFGPVVTISTFKTDDEEDALAKANDTIYGLAAMVFTKDFGRAHRVADRLEAGSVYINSSNDEDMKVPFGGFKMSGYGRELGEEAIKLYTEVKSVYMNFGSKF